MSINCICETIHYTTMKRSRGFEEEIKEFFIPGSIDTFCKKSSPHFCKVHSRNEGLFAVGKASFPLRLDSHLGGVLCNVSPLCEARYSV